MRYSEGRYPWARDAWDVAQETAGMVFCTLVVLTVIPVTTLLVFAGHGIAGNAGGWAVFAALVAATPVTFVVVYVRARKHF